MLPIIPGGNMRSFLVGLGVGVGLGVLFAPMSGVETRDNIRDRANDLADQAKETLEQGRERVRSSVTAIRDMAQRAAGSPGDNLADVENAV
jgi:gas vesicle protein